RRAGASVGQCLHDHVALGGDLVAQVAGRHLGEGRLAEPQRLQAPLVEARLEAVEEDVAPGLDDVEQADDLAVQAGRPVGQGAGDRRPLVGRVEVDPHVGFAHSVTSRVTGMLPMAPRAQPPMMAENRPAPPPAWTISRPSGVNLGRPPVEDPPAASPKAPTTPGPSPSPPPAGTFIPSAQPSATAANSESGLVPSSR